MTESVSPPSNGAVPVAANASTLPSEKTSLAGPISRLPACSGDMYAGVPMVVFVAVSAPPCKAREIPKSITRGPSAAMRMLPGLRSLWTRPRPWIACSASIRPPASRQTAASGSGPAVPTSSESDGPAT